VLDVDFLRLVAGKCDVEPAERAALEVVLPLELIEEIVEVVLVAHEQPVFAGVSERGAVFDEGAERRDAGAGADHDDRREPSAGRRKFLLGWTKTGTLSPGFTRSAR
jgi:hypothetical protein